MELKEFLRSQFREPGTQWSLGTFGAIAEFMRDPDEPAQIVTEHSECSIETARGAIRLVALDGMLPFASETAGRDSWSHRIALCLPADRCAMNRRTVLTELGPDERAIRAEDRSAVLFDVGLGALQVDVCVRSQDPELIAALRAEAGRPQSDMQSAAFKAILEHSPHRVFISRLGRIEAFQPIPPPHGRSPDGPHTHVLLNLLRHGLTHAATEPIPPNWVPCAHIYPPHPVSDAFGRKRPFDPNAHEAFQAILRAFGDEGLFNLKTQALASLEAGIDPETLGIAKTRYARNSLRVAVLQWAVTSTHSKGGQAEALSIGLPGREIVVGAAGAGDAQARS